MIIIIMMITMVEEDPTWHLRLHLAERGGRVLVNWRRAGAEDRDHLGICISVFLFVYFYLLGFYIPSLCFLSNKSSFAELSPCKQPVFQDKSNNQGRDGKQKLSPLLSKLSRKYFFNILNSDGLVSNIISWEGSIRSRLAQFILRK